MLTTTHDIADPPSVHRALPATMRGVLHEAYGEPETLRVGELERPRPKANEVLVEVCAANVSVGDHHLVTGKPYLIRATPFGGLPRPKNPVPGTTMSGRIALLGDQVSGFAVGDPVIAEGLAGAFAQFMTVPVDRLAHAPTSLSLEHAAAVPWGLTALQALRDHGRVEPGQRVLIIGASGGVGTWAVQIAKSMGAEVTGVCGPANVDWVRELGASEVLDYTQHDFVDGGARFDLVLDLVGARSLADCRAALLPEGTYIACAGGDGDWIGPVLQLLAVMVLGWSSRQKLTSFLAEPNEKDLAVLASMVDAGTARPVIGERHQGLEAVPTALASAGRGHGRGQRIVAV